MECPHCKHKLTIKDFIHTRFEFCLNCLEYFRAIDQGKCCGSPDFIFVRDTLVSGRLVVRIQCKSCGHVPSGSFPYSNNPSFSLSTLPDIDWLTRHERKNFIIQEIEDFSKRFFEYKKTKTVALNPV